MGKLRLLQLVYSSQPLPRRGLGPQHTGAPAPIERARKFIQKFQGNFIDRQARQDVDQ